ncbi:hypothetical protein CLOM_g12329 [Closterium sp. NIES-68]|nr:hypothetical protein CLOM_g12329 [Closterium sp. NIES-68]
MRPNKALGALVNVALLLIGLGLIGVALWLLLAATYGACLLPYQVPLIAVGGALLVAALVGFCGLACESNALSCLYLVVALVAVLASTAFTIFAFLVTGGTPLPTTSRGQTVYATWGFSPWMQAQVGNASWAALQTCLAQRRTCGDLRSYAPAVLNGLLLPPIEAGCCIPPQGCLNRTFRPTYYSFAALDGPSTPQQQPSAGNSPNDIPVHAAAAAGTTPPHSSSSSQQNCSAFSIEPQALCYACEYCKGGFLAQLHAHYALEKFVSLGASIAVLLLYLMACCAAFTGLDDDEPGLEKSTAAAAAAAAASKLQKSGTMSRVNTFTVAPGQFERSLSAKVPGQGVGVGALGGVAAGAAIGQYERSLTYVDKSPGPLDRSLTQVEKAVPNRPSYAARETRSREDTRSRSSYADDSRSTHSYTEDLRSCRSSKSSRSSRGSERGKEVFVVEQQERIRPKERKTVEPREAQFGSARQARDKTFQEKNLGNQWERVGGFSPTARGEPV